MFKCTSFHGPASPTYSYCETFKVGKFGKGSPCALQNHDKTILRPGPVTQKGDRTLRCHGGVFVYCVLESNHLRSPVTLTSKVNTLKLNRFNSN